MPIFNKSSAALVYDLINQANPSMPIPVSPANATLGVPAAATVAGQPLLNTAVVVAAITGKDYLGRKSVNYRRLNLATLTRGMTIQINKFSTAQNSGNPNAVVFSVYDLLQSINQQYGLNLTTDDVIDGNILLGSTQENGYYTTSVTVNAKPGSLGYTGSFTLKWRADGQDISGMIAVTDLDGTRKFPGGNDFSGAHAVVVSNMAYGVDWSDFILAGVKWNSYPNSWEGASTQLIQWMARFLTRLNALYGTTLVTDTPDGTAYGFSTWNGRVVDLSTAAGKLSAPEANADYYNRVLILTVPTALEATYGAGTHYIHYNV